MPNREPDAPTCALLKGTGRQRSASGRSLGLLAAVFVPALLAMARVWWTVDYYSHGFLIPLVSYAAFHPIAGRLGAPARDPRGYLVVLAALGLYVLGLGAGSATLQGLGFVAALAGVVLGLWGPAGLRRLAFPVGFLLFMVPLPGELVASRSCGRATSWSSQAAIPSSSRRPVAGSLRSSP
jgi:hypothetical protein